MTALTKHLPLTAYEGSLLSDMGKGLTVATAHHDLSPDEGAEVMAEIARRVNAHDALVAIVEAAVKYGLPLDLHGRAYALLAKLEAR